MTRTTYPVTTYLGEGATHEIQFGAPLSVVQTCSLDDSGMLRELGLTWVGSNAVRTYLRGPLRAYINVIETCLHMAADHGSEDPAARSAARWARREATWALEAGWARRTPHGGLEVK